MGRSRSLRSALAAGLVALLLQACCATMVTPAAVRAAPVAAEVRAARLAAWRGAIELADEFLASTWRHTLPEGRYVLDDETGMRFVTARGTWPIAVGCSAWGDLCIDFGFAAQERSWGFVVGENPGESGRVTQNSFFLYPDGSAMEGKSIARLLLHETTHTVYREGTVGFWNGVAYYLEAIFLFRYARHSAERRAHATGEEFEFFLLARSGDDEERASYAAYFAQHLAAGPTRSCHHGPPEDPPPAPLPPEAREAGPGSAPARAPNPG